MYVVLLSHTFSLPPPGRGAPKTGDVLVVANFFPIAQKSQLFITGFRSLLLLPRNRVISLFDAVVVIPLVAQFVSQKTSMRNGCVAQTKTIKR
jgi:hypothetical protein